MSAVRYHIRHRTAYAYTGRIDLCHTQLHLAPREDEGQETIAIRVDIEPFPDIQSERQDYFGNQTTYFAIERSHLSLDVVSHVTVEKSSRDLQLPRAGVAWHAVPVCQHLPDPQGVLLSNYLGPSSACPRLEALSGFLAPSLQQGKDIMELANELMMRIYTEYSYVSGATDVSTPLSEVMERKEGVCQDFAHLMIAALRQIGIPTRYVSGYLETVPPPGKEKLQGSDASHAWVEVYSPATGWVPFDPTNNTLAGGRHIKICHGRDYFDVQPLKGIFLGSGAQALSVEVDVMRV